MRDNIKLAFRSIRANKMRAMLTMLGIIIGIASVIAIMTISSAMNLAMEAQNAAMGYNNLNLTVEAEDDYDASSVLLSVPVASSSSNQYKYTQGMPPEALLDMETMKDFEQHFDDRIKGISYSWDAGSGKTTLAHQTTNVSLTGVNAKYLDVASFSKIELETGRWVTQEDVDKGKKVAVIKNDLAATIFGSSDGALGQQIDVTITEPNVTTLTVTIVGVYHSVATTGGNILTGTYSIDFSSFGNTRIYLPVSTALEVSRSTGITSISLAGVDGVDLAKFQQDIENYFQSVYTYKGYHVLVEEPWSSSSDSSDNTMKTLQTAFSVTAAISLLVGGIGVMNIMMVSITERTREIGVRKALGAKRRDIRMQFITESIVLSFIGGVIGIIIGMVAGNIAAHLMGYPATASITSVLLSFGVSVSIGIFFGFYPANKAAKMNPIDALRYE